MYVFTEQEKSITNYIIFRENMQAEPERKIHLLVNRL